MRRTLKFWVPVGVALFVAAGIIAWRAVQSLDQPLNVAAPLLFKVPFGARFARVAADLGRQGVMAQPRVWVLYARWKGVAADIKAGEYDIEPGTTPRALLDKMVSGQVVLHSLTIVDGWRVQDVFDAMRRNPDIVITLPARPPADLLRELGATSSSAPGASAAGARAGQLSVAVARAAGARAGQLTVAGSSAGQSSVAGADAGQLSISSVSATQTTIAGESSEGQFLPETYRFTSGTTDVDLLREAHAALQRVLDSAWAQRDPTLPAQNPYDLLIMASIVEKESGNPSELPKIAGLYWHRLAIGMRLQADPTLIYGLGDAYKGELHTVDLRTDGPYNTYTRSGLPPTPISLAGAAAIEATARPEKTDALYFVASAQGDGTHVFSATLDEHNAAVARYLKRPHQRSVERER